jgi:hypothetical protein
MSANGYRLLGMAVWHGGRWYLRRRVGSARTFARRGLLAGAGLVAAAVLVRRVSG